MGLPVVEDPAAALLRVPRAEMLANPLYSMETGAGKPWRERLGDPATVSFVVSLLACRAALAAQVLHPGLAAMTILLVIMHSHAGWLRLNTALRIRELRRSGLLRDLRLAGHSARCTLAAIQYTRLIHRWGIWAVAVTGSIIGCIGLDFLPARLGICMIVLLCGYASVSLRRALARAECVGIGVTKGDLLLWRREGSWTLGDLVITHLPGILMSLWMVYMAFQFPGPPNGPLLLAGMGAMLVGAGMQLHYGGRPMFLTIADVEATLAEVLWVGERDAESQVLTGEG